MSIADSARSADDVAGWHAAQGRPQASPAAPPEISPLARRLAAGALASLGATLSVGVVLAVATVHPLPSSAAALWLRLQPLHTLFALATVLLGIATLLEVETARGETGAPAAKLARLGAVLFALFFPLAALSIVAGRGSGREYLGWAPQLTPLLVGALVAQLATLARRFRHLVGRSPEGAWLVGLGLVCLPLALAESHLEMLVGLTLDRILTYEWHALDLLFAGWNAALYGFGVLAAGRTKPLRSRPLYLLAAFTFVSTFAHHHYSSPQPRILKQIAVAASLLAALSFVRHARALAAGDGAHAGPAAPFLRAVERWTLLAIGSGILLAIPQVNLVLHGTYAIVAHAMAAMIGVNVLLVLGCLAGHSAPTGEERSVAKALRATEALLALFWLDLVVAGTLEGVLRFEHPYAAFRPHVTRLLLLLPWLGAGLALALGRLGWLVGCRIVVSPAARRAAEPPARIVR